MKHILFPTDFSAAADNALVYALNMAKQLGASITAIHTYSLPKIRGAANLPETMKQVYDSIRLEEFKNFEDQIPRLTEIAKAHQLEEVPIRHMIKQGDLVRTIILTAEEEKVDLIVMGTEGASGFKEVFAGSQSGEVLENAYCPVLVVPEEARFDGILDRIAVTTTYQAAEKLALRWVLDFAQLFNAHVQCINVDVAHTEFFTKRMDDWSASFKDIPKCSFHVLEGSNVQESIANFLEEQQVDILAMLTHRRSFFEEMFNYSQTKKMAYHSKTPVLAIQAHALKS